MHLSLSSVTNKIKVDNPLKFRAKCTLNNGKMFTMFTILYNLELSTLKPEEKKFTVI